MIQVRVTRDGGDLLWRGDWAQARINADGSFHFDGAAQDIQPPYSVEVGEKQTLEDEDAGTPTD